MLDLSSMDGPSEREQAANEARLADHLLTKPRGGRGYVALVPPQILEQMIRDTHAAADEDDTVSVCYFIGGDEGPVKIGFAANVKSRLQTMRACSPVPLKLLATARGGKVREEAYHMQFDQYRLHGEWFERSPEIEAEIARLSNPGLQSNERR